MNLYYKHQKYFKNKIVLKRWETHKKPKNNQYDFIIAIPAYFEFDYLFKTLDSINKQDITLLSKTLVSIVINNSDSDSLSL